MATRKFERNLNKLGISEKFKTSLLNNFEEMNSEQAQQYPYFKAGAHKAFKKYRISSYRVHFSYCKECFGKYSQYLKCSFCDDNDLERIVLHDVQHRKEGY